jgi:hypothetical protein
VHKRTLPLYQGQGGGEKEKLCASLFENWLAFHFCRSNGFLERFVNPGFHTNKGMFVVIEQAKQGASYSDENPD